MKLKLFGFMLYLGRGPIPCWLTGEARQVTVYKAEHRDKWYTTPELALKSAPKYVDIKIKQMNVLQIGSKFFATKELGEIQVYDQF